MTLPVTQQDETTIRRRPDGSIDADFYLRRGALMRCAAVRETPAQLTRHFGRSLAALLSFAASSGSRRGG